MLHTSHYPASFRQGHHKGRGALSNQESRFSKTRSYMDPEPTIDPGPTKDPGTTIDTGYRKDTGIKPGENEWAADGLESLGQQDIEEYGRDFAPKTSAPKTSAPKTQCRAEQAKTIIARNSSPDVPFKQSINPYRGCEHGCVYCFARPTHAYLDLSPGLDFETRLSYKANAAELLEQELRKPSYHCEPIALGTNTDPYQPIEKQYRITRSILQVLQRYRHPFTIVTKGSLVMRDLDIIQPMAAAGLCSIAVSLTSMDRELKRYLEPRAASPQARLEIVKRFSEACVPVTVLLAPIIPAINDSEMETLLEQAVAHGAESAGYILLRLPREVKDLFVEWLQQHYPLRAQHVMTLIEQCRQGKPNDSRFGHRMRGTGVYANMLSERFRVSCRRLGIAHRESAVLDTTQFSCPVEKGDQLGLF